MIDPVPLGALAGHADVSSQMARGIAAHEAGDLVGALTAFESALMQLPDDPHAVSACATLLFELARPQAAFRLLLGVEKQLLTDAEGATNLAIAASACGQWEQAEAYFERALTLDGDSVRALTHLGWMAARERRWDKAVDYAARCLFVAGEHEGALTNLVDFLLGARRPLEALTRLEEAQSRFPGSAKLAARRALALALNGEFEAANHALAALGPEAMAGLLLFLGNGKTSQAGVGQTSHPSAQTLFCRQAFEAMDDCDWRYNDRLAVVVREQMDVIHAAPAEGDLSLIMYYALALPLSEPDMLRMGQPTWARLAAPPGKPLPPFSAKRRWHRTDERVHIGITVRSLRDTAATEALAAQLAVYDHTRFAFHLYSPTPQPQALLADPLLPHSVIEIAHFSDEEAVRRIRLDQLDLWVDTGFGTGGWRPTIAQRRVAPVQIQMMSWQRRLPAGPFDYNLSDTFVQPVPNAAGVGGAIVRLPHTCWLAARGQPPVPQPSLREHAGLPGDALVLCAWVPPHRIDPQTFELWMKLLRDLPDALLWLPAFALTAQANLLREAHHAGIQPHRVIFAKPASYEKGLSLMPLADLFLDPLRFNASQSLADALQMGLPAITCAGDSMASRMGGSIVNAAGLPECVVQDEAGYVSAVIELARNPARLAALRLRLQAGMATASLFDLPGRIREWETAWTVMVTRSRAGLPPCAFDVEPHQPDPH